MCLEFNFCLTSCSASLVADLRSNMSSPYQFRVNQFVLVSFSSHYKNMITAIGNSVQVGMLELWY